MINRPSRIVRKRSMSKLAVTLGASLLATATIASLVACDDAGTSGSTAASGVPRSAASTGAGSDRTEPTRAATAGSAVRLPGYDRAEIEAYCRGPLLAAVKEIWASTAELLIDEEVGFGLGDGKHPGGCRVTSDIGSRIADFDVYPFPYVNEPYGGEISAESYFSTFSDAEQVHTSFNGEICRVQERAGIDLRYCLYLPREDAAKELLGQLTGGEAEVVR